MKQEIDEMHYVINNLISKKAEIKEIDQVISEISKKPDFEFINEQINIAKNDIYEDLLKL